MTCRIRLFFIALLLVFSFLPTAFAASQDITQTPRYQTDRYDLYQFQEGHIAFAFPAKPSVLHEASAKDFFNDRTEFDLMIDDGEYMVHTADIAPMLDYLRKNYPELLKEKWNLETSAILTFANNFISIFDGKINYDESQVLQVGSASYPAAYFEYEYGDTPGVPYQGLGILDGTHLVIAMGSQDKVFQEMLRRLLPLDDKHVQEFLAMEPDVRTAGNVTATFPDKAIASVTDYAPDQREFSYEVFTPGRTYMRLEYLRAPLDMSDYKNKKNRDKKLRYLAETRGLKYGQGEVLEHEVMTEAAEGVYSISFDYQSKLENTGRFICKQFVSHEGVWVIIADDTAEGRAFVESAVFVP
jgi:hypothetical protein